MFLQRKVDYIMTCTALLYCSWIRSQLTVNLFGAGGRLSHTWRFLTVITEQHVLLTFMRKVYDSSFF